MAHRKASSSRVYGSCTCSGMRATAGSPASNKATRQRGTHARTHACTEPSCCAWARARARVRARAHPVWLRPSACAPRCRADGSATHSPNQLRLTACSAASLAVRVERRVGARPWGDNCRHETLLQISRCVALAGRACHRQQPSERAEYCTVHKQPSTTHCPLDSPYTSPFSRSPRSRSGLSSPSLQ